MYVCIIANPFPSYLIRCYCLVFCHLCLSPMDGPIKVNEHFTWAKSNVILYIKANMVSVCLVWTKIGQCLEDSSSHCTFPVVTNRAGWGGQGSRCVGPGEVPFLLKKSLGKTRDLHLIKQKYNLKKKLFSL